MNVRELFTKAIEVGIQNDPRGRELVEKDLQRRKKEYEKLSDKDKEFIDPATLDNPYPDSQILHATGQENVSSVIVGIDMEAGEVAVTKAMRDSGTPVDLIIAHHPEGYAYAKLWDVMAMQADILNRFGVPINTAQALMDKRIEDVSHRLLPVNHSRAVDAARLLGIPMINLHTPADNMVANYLQSSLDEKKPYTLDDVIDFLLEIPEYREARRAGAGPAIINGKGSYRTGQAFVDMTGGTEGAKDMFAAMSASGINTVVGMHFSDDHVKAARAANVNIIIAGHISSDNVGLNLLLDAVCGTDVTIYEASGFRRFSRL